MGPFGLCGRKLSVAAILVAVSLHPKIPFLAADARWQRWTSRIGTGAGCQRRYFGVLALLLRVQPERFELPAPFRRRIAKPLDVDAARQAAFDGSANQLGGKKGERDSHVDMADAAFLAQRNLLNVGH